MGRQQQALSPRTRSVHANKSSSQFALYLPIDSLGQSVSVRSRLDFPGAPKSSVLKVAQKGETMQTEDSSSSTDGFRPPEVFRSGGGEGDYLSRWKRIVEIDRLLRDGSFPNAPQLAEHCGVSPKSIYRDIEALRLELQAPIEYSRSQRGYHYTDNRFALPAVTLSDRDLFALLVAENAVVQYEGTPLHENLEDAFARILSHLPGDLRNKHALAARAVHFGGLPSAQMLPGVWSELCVAINNREVVELTYKLPKTGAPVERLIHRKRPPALRIDPFRCLPGRSFWRACGNP